MPGNLFAFTCKCSKDKGYEGFVSFTSKTRLIEHYTKTIGAMHVGGHKMIIFPDNADKLINKYYKATGRRKSFIKTSERRHKKKAHIKA